MARDREDHRAARVGGAELREPFRPLTQDRGDRRVALCVVDGRRLTVETEGSRERRLEARLALLALERLEQRGLFTADVGAGAHERVEVEVDAAALYVLAEQPRLVGLLHGGLEARNGFAEELATDVVVADGRAHGVGTERHPLDQRVRIETQDVAVVAGTGLAFVGVADGVLLHRRIARHERPLGAGREACAPATAQSARLDAIDDLFARELAGKHLAPGGIAADLEVGLERPRAFDAACERLHHHEGHAITPSIECVHDLMLTLIRRGSDPPWRASDARGSGGRPSSSVRRCRPRGTLPLF